MGRFVELVVRTEYSFDSIVRVPELFRYCKEKGFPAVGIVDKHSLHHVVEVEEASREYGVKAIYGCEFDVEYEIGKYFEIVLLAKSKTGYKNIEKLSSIAMMKRTPFLTQSELQKYSSDVVAIAKESLSLNREVMTVKDFFNKEDFYFAITNHGLESQIESVKKIKGLAGHLGVKLVATNDVFYLEKTDKETHDIRVAMKKNKPILPSSTDQRYLKEEEEMKSLFSDTIEAIESTWEIAEKCNFSLTLKGDTDFVSKYPSFKVPEDFTMEVDMFKRLFTPTADFEFPLDVEEFKKMAYLCRLAWEGYFSLYPKDDISAMGRLKEELGIILAKEYADYFLIIQDFIRHGKEKLGIPFGPGRGSAVGSLAVRSLKITEIDPLKHKLLFERFLNPYRKDDPDMDIDVSTKRRKEVIQYIISKYGIRNVAKILAFDRYGTLSSIQSVGKALVIPEWLVSKVCKYLNKDISIEENLKLDEKTNWKIRELKKLIKTNEQVRKMIWFAIRVQGLAKNATTHAAGIVISNNPFFDELPMMRDSDKDLGEGAMKIQFTKEQIEKLGFLKIDLLGLRNVDVLDEVKRKTGVYEIPMNDQTVLELYRTGDLLGVFQMDGEEMRRYSVEVSPKSLEDIVVLVALYRPGPKEMIPVYAKNKREENKIIYDKDGYPLKGVEVLAPILDRTYGVIVYQEQIIGIAHMWAGMDLGEADLLRRAISKKDKDKMEEQRVKFIDASLKFGRDADTTNFIFELIEEFVLFGFNEAHAAAYATVSYETCYFKKHYPVEYMSCLLTSVMDDTKKASQYIQEAERMGVQVYSPDINSSQLEFVASDDAILFGLPCIKNVGINDAKRIVEARSLGEFTSFENFLLRVNPEKRVKESLIKVGAFDRFGSRKTLLSKSEGKPNTSKVFISADQYTFAEIPGIGSDISVRMGDDDFTVSEKVKFEIDLIGVPVTKFPSRLVISIPSQIMEASPEERSEWMKKVIDLLNKHPGEEGVFFKFDEKETDKKQEVKISIRLIEALEKQIGKENVTVQPIE